MFGKLFKRDKRLEFEIEPRVGLLPLRLDMTSDQVREVMKSLGQEPSSVKDDAGLLRKLGIDPPEGLSHSHAYLDNSLCVEFDQSDRASFIGIAPHGDIRVLHQGLDVFSVSAEDLFEHLKRKHGIEDLAYDADDLLLPDQILTLWQADPQYDLVGERFPVWGQIGVGSPDYLRKVRGIENGGGA